MSTEDDVPGEPLDPRKRRRVSFAQPESTVHQYEVESEAEEEEIPDTYYLLRLQALSHVEWMPRENDFTGDLIFSLRHRLPSEATAQEVLDELLAAARDLYPAKAFEISEHVQIIRLDEDEWTIQLEDPAVRRFFADVFDAEYLRLALICDELYEITNSKWTVHRRDGVVIISLQQNFANRMDIVDLQGKLISAGITGGEIVFDTLAQQWNFEIKASILDSVPRFSGPWF